MAVRDQSKQAAAPAMSSNFDRVDSVMRDDSNEGAANKIHGLPVATTKTASSATPIAPTAVGPRTPPAVRVLGLHEYKAAAACLADAFAEDVMAMYFINTPDRADWTKEQKWALHVRIMEYVTYAHLLKGLVVAAGPGYDCVALWMPPGKNMDDWLTVFRSGMWRLNFDLSREGGKRFFTEFLPLLHDTKAAVLGDRDPTSWYLVYIGTRPAARGRGLARAAIDHVARGMADPAGRACYLESSSVANRALYNKLGFEHAKSIYLQRAEKPVELEIMVREPVARAE